MSGAAAVDVVGFLPAPSGKGNKGAVDILEGQLFAYGIGSSIAVVEVEMLQIACVLQGGHKSAAVTSLKWCPDCHSRDVKGMGNLRLASGDHDGSVVVWNVVTQTVVARLDECYNTREIARQTKSEPGSVQGLAWVLCRPCLLAVVISPATLLLWDTTGSSIVWKRDLSTSEVMSHLTVDPLNRRRVCLCGSNGALLVITLTEPEKDVVQVSQYRVNIPQADKKDKDAATPTFEAVFGVTRDLLFVLLAREVVVFDLELGQPAASLTLVGNRAPFTHLLGVWGQGVSHGAGDEGGVDCIYTLHQDGQLSIWVRHPGELRYSLTCTSRLTPPPLRQSSSAPPTLLAIRAQVWKHDLARDELLARPSLANVSEVTKKLAACLLPEKVPQGRDETPSNTMRGSMGGRADTALVSPRGGATSLPDRPAHLSDKSLLVLAITGDGRVWQWDARLPQFPDRSLITSPGDTPIVAMSGSIHGAASAVPRAVPPCLVGLMHTLPFNITTFSLFPRPVPASALRGLPCAAAAAGGTTVSPRLAGVGGASGGGCDDYVLLGAAATASGNIEIFTVHRGAVTPLSAQVVVSLSCHKEMVRGIRWLGSSPRLVSFSSERTQHGYKNQLLLTDVRDRRTMPFREVGIESMPMLGIRASPLGTYVLVLLKGAPAELWAANCGTKPYRVRLIDLPFSAVDWVTQPEAATATAQPFTSWQRSPRTSSSAGVLAPDQHSSDAGAVPSRQAAPTEPSIGGDKDLASLVSAATAPHHEPLINLDDGPAPGQPGATATSPRLKKPTSNVDMASLAQPQPPTFNTPAQPTTPVNMSRAYSMPLAAQVAAQVGVGSPATPTTPHADEGESAEPQLVEEFLSFTLWDGRAGVLSVKGRKVTDMRAKRPIAGLLQPLDIVASCMTAWGTMVFLGDAEGNLFSWDTSSGRCSTVPTNNGLVRRIQVGPPPPAQLINLPPGMPPPKARLAVLFSSGMFGVYELDAHNRLRAAPNSGALCAKLGKALDTAWLAVPGAVGGGTVLAVVTEDGSLALADASQPCDGEGLHHTSGTSRMRVLRQLLSRHAPGGPDSSSHPTTPTSTSGGGAVSRLSGSGAGALGVADMQLGGVDGVSSQCAVLAPAKALGTCLLMRRSWALLLRLLLQLGLSQTSLLCLSSPHDSEDDDEVLQEILHLLPKNASKVALDLASSAGILPFDFQASGPTSGPVASVPTPDMISWESETDKGPGVGGAVLVLPVSHDPASSGAGQRQATAAAADGPGSFASTLSAATVGDAGLFGRLGAGLKPQFERLQKQFSTRTSTRSNTPDKQARRAAPDLDAVQPEMEAQGLGDGSTFNGDLVALLRVIGRLRTTAQLLQPAEWRSYAQALQQHSISGRMAVAAKVAGSADEARFWTHLPATLVSVKAMMEEHNRRRVSQESAMLAAHLQPGKAVAVGSGGGSSDGSAINVRRQRSCDLGTVPVVGHSLKKVATGNGVGLWDPELALSEAQERTIWHEAMSRSVFETEELQEKRMLEYVVLGDFQTAVAFLLASTPERSARYYRDAVCTMALAAAASHRDRERDSAVGPRTSHSQLMVQASKVIAAHASSVGDPLLGVPLHCAAGLYGEAASLLQDAGLWRYAANLAAASLAPLERAPLLQRWAEYVYEVQGQLWQAVGILTAAGCMRQAVQLLRAAGLPDCASAYQAACRSAGLTMQQVMVLRSSEGGEIPESGPVQQGAPDPCWQAEELFDVVALSDPNMAAGLGGCELVAMTVVEVEFEKYVCELLQAL